MTWETVRLGDVAEQIRGVTYSKGEAIDTPTSGYVALVRAGNIGEAGLHMDDLIHVPATRVSPRQWLRVDDVVVASSSGSLSVVGKAARVVGSIDATFGAFCKVLRPFSGIDAGYFAHYFRTAEYRRYISSVAAGANINNLRNEDLDRIEIPLPPLPEQRRIAAILDDADALRSTRRESLRLLRAVPGEVLAVRDSRGWNAVSLGEVASLQGGLTVSARRATLPRRAGYLRVANVFRGAIDLTEIKDLGVTQAELERTRIRLGDLLVVEGHGNPDEVGRAALVTELPSADLTHQNHLFRLRPNAERVLGRFLELVLNSSDSREYFRRVANTTSGLNTLNATSVRSLRMRLAPLAIQDEVVREVDGVSNSIRAAERSSAQLDELFASLQYRAFRGEL